ncbi:MAG: hypothetical protein E3J72_09685 [Planctomycetota bacterium]|nr:MAG: hypothetical protein E3J72_09685 [Planctomycetota bacterium]
MKRFGRFLLIFMTAAALITASVCFLELWNKLPTHESNTPVEGVTREAGLIQHTPPPDNASELKFEEKTDESASTDLQNNTIFGYVYSEKTGDPIAGALVHVIYIFAERNKSSGAEPLQAVTDENGLFRIEKINLDAEIRYQVDAESYSVYANSIWIGGKNYEAELGRIKLSKGTNVTFRITDTTTGKLLPGEGLLIRNHEACCSIDGKFAKQNLDGSITLRLKPGEYGFFTNHLQYEPKKKEGVKVGKYELTVNFSLIPGEDISGIVVDHEGNPVVPAKVIFRTEGSYDRSVFFCDNNGRFTAYNSFRPGVYNITADAENSFGFTVKGVPSGTKGLIVRLPETIIMNGTLIDEETGGPAKTGRASIWINLPDAKFANGHSMSQSTDSSYSLKMPRGLSYLYINVGSATYESISDRKIVLPEKIGNCFTYDIRMKPRKYIVGKVTAADTKQALEGVKVTLSGTTDGKKREITTRTGTNGKYNFNMYAILEGKIENILFSYDGFLAYSNNSYCRGYSSDCRTLNVELRRAGKITGTVTGRDGKPLAGITVINKSKWPNKSSVSHTTTDKSGNYTFETLDPVASHIIFVGGSEGRISRKRKVWVSAGKTAINNIVMFNRSEISGRVISFIGNPVEKAKIKLTVAEAITDNTGCVSYELHEFNVKSDANGFYKFEKLPPGTCTFKVTAGGYHDYKWTGLELGEEELRKNANLELDPGMSVAGVVLDDFNRPIESATIQVYPDNGHHQQTVTNENGHFRFTTLKEGYVRLYASANGYIGNPNRRVKAGHQGVCFNLILGGTLTGKVTGLDTFSETCISVSPEGSGSSSSSCSNADGSFVLQLHPGKYTVKVTGKGFIANRVKGIEIEAGRNTFITIPVLSGCSQTVKVLDADSFQPIHGAGVYFRPYAASQEERQKLPWNICYNNHKRTDVSGLATYSGLMPGTYQLEVERTYYQRKIVGIVHVADGPGESREVLLQSFGSIEVFLKRSGTNSLGRCRVHVRSIDDENAANGSKYSSSSRICAGGNSRTFHNVPKGLYRITLKVPGYNPYEQRVYVAQGEDVTCTFQH